jgi:hypothetical protein
VEQYNNLHLTLDYDFETKTEENIKIKIRGLCEGFYGPNIHYSFSDKVNERNKNKLNL